jgi:DNA-binding response OmpR family regulator
MHASKKRILLVDDNAELLEAMQFALEEHGYEVLTANDGAEGLMRAERDAPDLIVLDVVMPRRSGFLVLERLRSRKTHCPHIIMVTANQEPRHQEFAEEKVADAFFQKPFDISELVAKIDALLEV